jgi:hypothetical protein
MALKIKFPTRIHLLRGNHEDEEISKSYGFEEECKSRLHEDTKNRHSAFKAI